MHHRIRLGGHVAKSLQNHSIGCVRDRYTAVCNRGTARSDCGTACINSGAACFNHQAASGDSGAAGMDLKALADVRFLFHAQTARGLERASDAAARDSSVGTLNRRGFQHQHLGIAAVDIQAASRDGDPPCKRPSTCRAYTKLAASARAIVSNTCLGINQVIGSSGVLRIDLHHRFSLRGIFAVEFQNHGVGCVRDSSTTSGDGGAARIDGQALADVRFLFHAQTALRLQRPGSAAVRDGSR